MNKKKERRISWTDLYIYPTAISCIIIIIGLIGDKCTQSTNNIPLEKDSLNDTKHTI